MQDGKSSKPNGVSKCSVFTLARVNGVRRMHNTCMNVYVHPTWKGNGLRLDSDDTTAQKSKEKAKKRLRDKSEMACWYGAIV